MLLDVLRRTGRGWALPGLLLLLVASMSFAQDRVGSLVGKINDASGAGVPNAEIEISGPTLIRALTVITDGTGEFVFGALPPGLYNLQVKAKGFVTLKQTNIQIQVGRQVRTDLKLEVGAVSESVTVSGEALLIDTAQSAPQTNITQEAYDKLPKGRSFSTLLALAPGTRFEPKQGTGGAGGFSVDGASGSENVYNIDGIDNTTLLDGKLPRNAEIPNEFVSEVQLKSGADAQYGGAVGGVVNVTVRSGSNQFHGEVAFHFINTWGVGDRRAQLRLDPFNAVNPAAQYFSQTKDDYRFLNPVAYLGGRIIKDKLWFSGGLSPMFEKWERPVSFRDARGAVASTQNFTREDRADYNFFKLDYAPASKLRLAGTYFYQPVRQRGTLPGIQGLDNPNTPWSQYGSRQPATSFNFSGTYILGSKTTLYAQYGQNYRNNKLYGRPTGTYFTTTSTAGARDPQGNLLNLPFTFGAVELTPNSRTILQDIQKRGFTEVNVSHLFNLGGQHNLKAGYTRNDLSNNSTGDGYPNDWVRFFWGQSYGSVIAQPGQRVRGQFGYFRYRVFRLGTGNVGSSNNGLYVNDNWRVNKRLTLNLGLRTEREFIPSFSANGNLPSKAITFNFNQKMAPRLGFAYDIRGDGKVKLFGSFGFFYDLFKYELPRGSFGGDQWVDYYYTLDTVTTLQNLFNIAPGAGCPTPRTCTAGRFIEARDNRIPSNDPSEGLLDPNLKPMKQRNFDFGAEWNFAPKMVFRSRYVRRDLLAAIEDVGLLTPLGEQYFITNPGFGLSVDSRRLNGYPATPKAKRQYDAMELQVSRRYDKWLFDASYTYSRLYGNYSGLASSDENGRNSPNVNRYFDLPWNALTQQGKVAEGRLATDRPHTFKFFTGYTQKSKIGSTTFAPVIFAFSGTPLTSELGIDGLPTYPFGRGDLGRTPTFFQTDLLVYHDFSFFKSESRKLRFEFNARNLFDQKRVIDRFVTLNHAFDGDVSVDDPKTLFRGFDANQLLRTLDFGRDPRYGMASSFQAPREIRLALRFLF
jgi:outer membrane receptor protein involved in Fe transport